MVNVLTYGTQSYHNFTFAGLTHLVTKAKHMRTYYENTTLDSTTFSNLKSEASTYIELTGKMQANLDKIYFDPGTYPYIQLPDVNSSSTFYSDYLKVNLYLTAELGKLKARAQQHRSLERRREIGEKWVHSDGKRDSVCTQQRKSHNS